MVQSCKNINAIIIINFMLLLLSLFVVVAGCVGAILDAQNLVAFFVVWHEHAPTIKPPCIPATMQERFNLEAFYLLRQTGR